jgi:hypothetical protein
VLISILVLISTILIIMQNGRTQTYIAERVASRLSKVIDGDISFEKIHLHPFNTLLIKNLVVVDKKPVIPTEDIIALYTDHKVPVDTFFKAEYVTARFGIKGLFKGEGIFIKEAAVKNGNFNLVIEEDDTNLERIFGIKKKENKEKKEKGRLFEIEKTKIENLRFTMKILKEDRVDVEEGGIDWNDLDVDNIYINVSDMIFENNVMSGMVERMSFNEKSGYICHDISGEATVGNGKTYIAGFSLHDPWSSVEFDYFSMSYKSSKEFSDFINKIYLDARINPSHVSFGTIGFFAPQVKYAKMETEIHSAEFHGPISDFIVEDLRFSIDENRIIGDAKTRISGIPEVDQMRFDTKINELKVTTKGLENFINGWNRSGKKIDISKFGKKESFILTGNGKGLLNDLDINAVMKSRIGKVDADVRLTDVAKDEAPIGIAGRFISNEFDLGRFLDNSLLGPCTLDTKVRTKFESGGNTEISIDSLHIDKLRFNNYDYHNINALGSLKDQIFDGRIICNEPNLNFMFQGAFALSSKTQNAIYRFYANVGFIDLQALNFDKRGISKASFWTSANFNWINREDILGNIEVNDIMLENEEGRHKVGNINVSSHSNNDQSRLILKSDFLEGLFTSTGSIIDFIQDATNITAKEELPAFFKKPQYTWSGHTHDLSLKFYDSRNILAFAAPGIYIADGTGIRVHVDEDGVLDSYINSQRIAYNTTYIKDITGQISNKEQMLASELQFGSFSFADVLLQNNNLELYADNNNFGIKYDYNNMESDAITEGELLLSGSMARNEQEEVVCYLDIAPSDISYRSINWSLLPSQLDVKKDRLKIANFGLKSGKQSMTLSGGIAKNAIDTLRMEMNSFNISVFDKFIKQSLGLEGKLTGNAFISSAPSGKGIELAMVADSTSMGGEDIGKLNMLCKWDEMFSKFNIEVNNDIDGINTLDIKGSYTPSINNLEATATLDGLNLGYIQPFLTDLFSEFKGKIYGKIHADGPINKLGLESEGTRIEDGRVKIDYTNVPYKVSGPVRVDEYGLYFDNVAVEDGLGGHGSLNGSINYEYFKNMSLDVHAKVDRVLCIDIDDSKSDYFYGRLTGTGDVAIKGPMNSILLDISATTTGPGQLHIPLSSTATAGTTNLLKFKEPEIEIEVDPYEEMMARYKEKKSMSSDLAVKIKAKATPEVQAFIEIDKASGNVLSGQGNGNIELDITSDVFDIKGDYTITNGNYKFVALGLAARDFTIQDGGTLKFSGDIMNTTLDIDALYRTKTSLSTLISDTTSVNSRKTVECGIRITDKLTNPRLGFSINIPDIDPTIKAKVENALSTEDKIQKQFLSLIISNSFLPDEQSGIVNNSSVLYNNMTEVLSNQLNNILEKLNIPVDLGLNYMPNERGNDIFDVAVSTHLFNNRVLVNGNLGNRQYKTSGTNSDVVGDLDIEIKLNRSGAFRLNLFSHSADQYSNYLDNSQRNGIGLAFQREFTKFKDFFKTLFMGKKKREELEAQEALKPVETKEIIIESKNNKRKDNGKR